MPLLLWSFALLERLLMTTHEQDNNENHEEYLHILKHELFQVISKESKNANYR